jgi:tripartite-type tricarboxylate transporter receptor subunit TctC
MARSFGAAVDAGRGVSRRRALQTGAVAAASLAAPWLRAQGFPERSIVLVVPAPPGGTASIAARALQEPLSAALGQSVVVDNKVGNSGATGALAVLRAKPDGHHLLMSFSGFHVMSPHLLKLPYDPMVDLQPVCNIFSAPQVLAVRGDLADVNSAQELVAHAKRHPNKLSYGSAGNGSVQHIAGELFKAQAGVAIRHQPYRGTGMLLQDLLWGQVDLMLTTAPPLMPHLSSGRIKALMVAAKERLSSLPQVPCTGQVGLPQFEVSSWFGLHTHAQAPKAAVERIAREVQKIVANPDFKEHALSQGAFADYLNPAQMLTYTQREYERWGRVIREGRIKAD